MNKKMQLTLYSSLTFFILVVCALLPRFIAAPEKPAGAGAPETLSLSERTEMFLMHWAGSGPGTGEGFVIENINREEMPENSLSLCGAVSDRLRCGFVPDEPENGYEISGEQFYDLYLPGDPGKRMRLCHVWYQWTGNWQNWFNLCIDADTGVIYYFYVSSGTAAGNTSDFDFVPEDFILKPDTDAPAIARLWPAYCRFECVSVVLSGRYNDDRTPIYTAAYISGDGEISYDISCKYYPQILLDVRFSVIGTGM